MSTGNKTLNKNEGNGVLGDVSNCPDLTLLWEQILLKNEKGELTSYEKHSLCEALNYMERKGMITLKSKFRGCC
jgi:hypothetical protein